MMPCSSRESSSCRTWPFWPKRKLFRMKPRRVASRESMGEPRAEAVDELVDEELGGEDADKGHVVLDPDRPAAPELFEEEGGGAGVEDAVLLDPVEGQEVVDIVLRQGRWAGTEEALGLRRPVGLLGAAADGGRGQVGGDLLQDGFLGQRAHL